MKGACSMPASRRLKLIERKMGWALTSEAPLPWQPSLSLGSLARSCRITNKLLKQKSGDRAGGRAETWTALKGKSDESGNNIQSPSQVAQLIFTV